MTCTPWKRKRSANAPPARSAAADAVVTRAGVIRTSDAAAMVAAVRAKLFAAVPRLHGRTVRAAVVVAGQVSPSRGALHRWERMPSCGRSTCLACCVGLSHRCEGDARRCSTLVARGRSGQLFGREFVNWRMSNIAAERNVEFCAPLVESGRSCRSRDYRRQCIPSLSMHSRAERRGLFRLRIRPSHNARPERPLILLSWYNHSP